MTGNPTDTPYLFVYGTLKRGFDNPFSGQLSNTSEYIGEGCFPGKLYLVSWYPGALYVAEAASFVHGEIYRMSHAERLLRLLDEYEEVLPDPGKSLYVRKIVPVLTQDGTTLSSWAYLYNQPAEGLQELPDGRFPGSN